MYVSRTSHPTLLQSTDSGMPFKSARGASRVDPKDFDYTVTSARDQAMKQLMDEHNVCHLRLTD
jgi:hypothetical protein